MQKYLTNERKKQRKKMYRNIEKNTEKRTKNVKNYNNKHRCTRISIPPKKRKTGISHQQRKNKLRNNFNHNNNNKE